MDLRLNLNGVSVYHSELFLKQEGKGKPRVCVRDNSKNGTGVGKPTADDEQGWQLLKRGDFKPIGNGYKLLLPFKGRKNGEMKADPVADRTLTVYLWDDKQEDAENVPPNVAAAANDKQEDAENVPPNVA